MAIDINRYKQKQQEFQEQAAARQSGGYRFWRPEKPTTNVRFLPAWRDELKQFEREVWMHWSVGSDDQTFPCPQKTPDLDDAESACPICAHVDALRATGDPADEEAAEQIRAKPSYYSNIIDLDDPIFTQKDYDEWKANSKKPDGDCPFDVGSTKVQVFRYGPMIFEQLVSLFSALGQDLTDLKDGYDIIIQKKGKKLNTKYQCMVNPPAKPVNVIGDLQLTDLDRLAKPKKLADMAAAVNPALPPPGPPGPGPSTAAPPNASLPAPSDPAEEEPDEEEESEPEVPAAAKAKAVEPEPEADSEEGPPECFKNKEVFSQTDVLCVGGHNDEDNEDYDKCPYYQQCGEAVGVLKVTRRGRRKAAKPKNNKAAASEADLLEQELAQAMND